MSSRLLAILACLMFMVVLSTASMGGVWRDDFDGAEIGPGWEYTNPPKQCEYEVADGFFSLKLEGQNDIWGGQDNAAKLLMEAPKGDYSLETIRQQKPQIHGLVSSSLMIPMFLRQIGGMSPEAATTRSMSNPALLTQELLTQASRTSTIWSFI